jgi:uncharacterized protein
MVQYADLPVPGDGRLADNITHFARALRRAGLPVGPGRVIDAIRAVEVAGFTRRPDFYYTLMACFVSRPEHLATFGQVFRLYWRDPQFLEHMMAMLSPLVRGVNAPPRPKAAERRAAEALLDGIAADQPQQRDTGREVEFDATLTFSADEKLRQTDFEQMTLAEQAAAKRAIARLDLKIDPIKSRRTQSAVSGDLADWRGTLRTAMRRGGEVQRLERKQRRQRWPNLVALCDISGSMSSYSRMLLHFLHSAANSRGAGWARVHGFTFGTRLTNITRHLATRDADAALSAVGREAPDWEGGTRIGACLHTFNRDWSRRVLGQGAVVLLITDGLDRDTGDTLERAAERLHLSARQVIWLNPLLRWDGFAPRARGIKTLLPHVDRFVAGHNIQALEDLARVLSGSGGRDEKQRLMRLMA